MADTALAPDTTITDGASAGSKGRLFWPALLVVLVVDLISKWLAVRHLEPQHVPHPVVGEFVRFTLGYNPGAAFSMHVGSASRWVFTVIALLVLVMLGRLYRETPPAERLRIVALGLVCGGAIGNLLDRLRSAQGVVDFIDIGVGSTRFWTFNVADMGVSIGAVLLAWTLLREEQRTKGAASR